MSRARRRAPQHPGQAAAAPASERSLANGFKGLNGIAGNRALIAALARRTGTDRLDHEAEDVRPLEEDEQVLARLRVLLDGADKAQGFGGLRAWALELLAAMHEALAATEDYDGGLEQLAEDLGATPDIAGRNREKWLEELAELLAAEGEQLHRLLARQLPPSRDTSRDPLKGGSIAVALVTRLQRQVGKALPALQRDQSPGDGAATLGGAAIAIGGRRRRKRKRAR